MPPDTWFLGTLELGDESIWELTTASFPAAEMIDGDWREACA